MSGLRLWLNFWRQKKRKYQQKKKELKTNGKYNKTNLIAEPGKQEIVVIQEFDAPREFVFKAFTNPQLYVQWLGPRNLPMTLETFEPKSGGSWRYIHRDKEGNVYAFHGVNHEVTAPERIISAFEFEGLPEPGHVTLETARFEALPGDRTRLTVQSVFHRLKIGLGCSSYFRIESRFLLPGSRWQ